MFLSCASITSWHVSCRAEIEAQEQIIERLERKVRESDGKVKDTEKRAAAAEALALEKENMINYVGEEVERVKGMFEQKVGLFVLLPHVACLACMHHLHGNSEYSCPRTSLLLALTTSDAQAQKAGADLDDYLGHVVGLHVHHLIHT